MQNECRGSQEAHFVVLQRNQLCMRQQHPRTVSATKIGTVSTTAKFRRSSHKGEPDTRATNVGVVFVLRGQKNQILIFHFGSPILGNDAR
jgi:hypothetical protein